MKRNKVTGKRLLAFVLSVCMILSLMPAGVGFAAEITEKIYAAAYQNAAGIQDTTLPETVMVDGISKAVTWSIRSSKISVPYETVTVSGSTEDGDTVSAQVEVIPAKDNSLVYFVDVSRDGQADKESRAFESVKALAGSSLKNTVPDQAYTEESGWGRKSGVFNTKGVGNLDVTDKYQTGMYGSNNSVNSLTWQLYLEAGEYTMTAGFIEWWQNSRTMQIVANGTASSNITLSGTNMEKKTGEVNFTVSQDGPVTVEVRNPNGGQAPVISWFAVAKGKVTTPEIGAETEVVVKGGDVETAAQNKNGLTYKGYGLLSGNSTSDLLMDYKQESPEKYQELLEVLFGGEHPLLNHVKVEMGNDGNNSTGADSCTMRFEDEEADASRSPGFQLAADAKAVNPRVKVSFLRWEMPAWVQSKWNSDRTGAGYEAIYKWYKETIFDAYEKYGYVVDYVDPDKNETRDPDGDFIKWFRNRVKSETEFPEYMGTEAQDAYHSIRIIASDENTTLNIVPDMRNDAELYNAVDAVGFHYSTGTKTSTADYRTLAEADDKEVWYSEGCATFSYTEYQENKTTEYGANSIGGYQSPLALVDNVIASFVYSRKTHYIFQPAIGSFYEGSQYDHKEIISAREPWAGYVHYDPVIYMLQHFTKFAETGWENEDNTAGIWRVIANATENTSGNRGDLGHLVNESGNPSYMTIASPDKKDFSVVIVNNSSKTLPYAIKAENMDIAEDAALEIWETRTDSYMQYRGEAEKEDGCYVLDVAPYSVVTVTTLDCDGKEEYAKRLPEENEKTVLDTDAAGKGQDSANDILYADDFEYSDYPVDYLEKRGDEPRYMVDFTGAYVVENGSLKQVLSQSVGQWNNYEPNTVVGDFRWMNYKAGVDVQPAEGSYAGLNIRQQTGMGFEGSGYSLRITKDGAWTLKKRGTTLAGGSVKASADGVYRLELEGKDSLISAWVDGALMACYNDPNPELFGRVRLGCGWAETVYDNLKVEKVEGYEPYATEMIDNASDRISYEGSWDIIAGAGGSNNDWYRSTSTSKAEGASFRFTMNGGGFALIGENGGTAVLDVEVDGVQVASDAATKSSQKHCAAYVQYGLTDGEHQVKVTVKSGTLVLDAVDFLPYNTTDKIVSVDEIYVAAYADSIPQLPQTVTCTRASGTTVEEEVVWNTKDLNLKPYDTAMICGTTKESGIAVSAKAEVIPKQGSDLVYFVDASRDAGKESKAFELVSGLAGSTLKNTVADQVYTAESGWGRTATVFKERIPSADTDVTDKYQTGWYSNTKTDWLVYELTLEAGTYELTAGFHEWWNNRSMKISVSGDGVDKVTSEAISVSGVGDNASGSVKFTVKETGIVTLEIENANNGEAPVLSWFGVAKVAGDSIVSVEEINTAVYEGAALALPETVTCQTAQGKEIEKKVTWDTENITLHAFDTVTVTGTIEDAELTAKAMIEVVPENLEYFVSAGTGTGYLNGNTKAAVSKAYQAVAALVPGLKNDASDAAYTAERGWGYSNDGTMSATVDNGDRPDDYISTDKYAVGLRDKTKGSAPMTYYFTLEPGVYMLSAGYHEFYGANRSRDMQPGVVWIDAAGEKQEVNGERIQLRSADQKQSITFTLDTTATVEYRLAYVSGEAPMFSWLAVSKLGEYTVDKSKLQEAVTGYTDVNSDKYVDSSKYTEESYHAFADALAEAQELLTDENASQSQLSEALKTLEQAYANLEEPAPAPDKSGLEKAVKDYTDVNSDKYVDGSAYTEESYREFADALTLAGAVLEDPDATEGEIATALAILDSAYSRLEKQSEPVKPDKGSLQGTVDTYKGADESKYTPETYQTYREALQAAEKVLADENATEEQIKAAGEALRRAYAELKLAVIDPKPTVTALAAPSIASVKSSAAKTGSVVTIRVNTVANAASYAVFRKVGSKVTIVGETTNGTIQDTKPVSGKKAYYYAAAKSGNTAKYTDSAAGAARAITLAADTKKVSAKKSGKKVKVTFRSVKGAKGYLIYRAEKKNGTYKKLTKKPVKKTSYIDTKAKAKKTYYYRVVVYGKNKTYSAGKVSKKVKMK